jgi:hypothetical protein
VCGSTCLPRQAVQERRQMARRFADHRMQADFHPRHPGKLEPAGPVPASLCVGPHSAKAMPNAPNTKPCGLVRSATTCDRLWCVATKFTPSQQTLERLVLASTRRRRVVPAPQLHGPSHHTAGVVRQKVRSRILAASRTPWIKLPELDVTAAAVSRRETYLDSPGRPLGEKVGGGGKQNRRLKYLYHGC